MKSHTTRYLVGLGLLAGSLAIAPAAKAQVQVTGGEVSGQAAFFVPEVDAAGNVRLFDVGVETLELETTNGVTTTSVFTPGGAAFQDVNEDGLPSAGDTGTLQGGLTGLAFTSDGTPVPFSDRPTVLNFTLDTFESNLGIVDGTLIRSEEIGAAPLVFLPGLDSDAVELDDDDDFVVDGGELQVGDFEAAINDGIIAIPSSLEFRESSSDDFPVTVVPSVLSRRIKFEFAGTDVTPADGTDFNFLADIVDDDDDIDDDFDDDIDDDLDDDDLDDDLDDDIDDDLDDDLDDDDDDVGFDDDDLDDDLDDDDDVGFDDDDDSDDDDDDGFFVTGSNIRFVGAVNNRFRIQSVGTRGDREFQIRGTLGYLDIAIDTEDADIRRDDVLSEDAATSYRIRGESEGLFAFYGPDFYGFSSFDDSRTNFKFEQGTGSDRLRLEGRSEGPVSFYALAGFTDGDFFFDDDSFFLDDDVDFIDLDFGSGLSCNVCGFDFDDDEEIVIENNIIRVGRPIVVTVAPSPVIVRGGGQRGNSVSFRTTTVTNVTFNFNTSSSVGSNLFVLAGPSSTAFYQYSYVANYRYLLLANFAQQISPVYTRVDVVNNRSDRYYLVSRIPGQGFGQGLGNRRQVLTAYQQLGPACRIFPGLVGLREISPDDLDDLDLDLDDDIALDDDDLDDDDTGLDDDDDTDLDDDDTGLDDDDTGLDDDDTGLDDDDDTGLDDDDTGLDDDDTGLDDDDTGLDDDDTGLDDDDTGLDDDDTGLDDDDTGLDDDDTGLDDDTSV